MKSQSGLFSTVIFGTVILSVFLLLSLQSQAKSKRANPSASLVELEKLDSAANLLLTVSDSSHPGQCHIQPLEARKLLMVIHPMIDDIRKKTAGSPSSKIADPKWEKNCAQGCHCGLYASILEEVGDPQLSDPDRELMNRLDKKAQKMSAQEIRNCSALTSKWFCKSALLKQLRQEAKNYPDPAHGR